MINTVWMVLLLGVLARAMYTDILYGKIENALIAMGALAGSGYAYDKAGTEGVLSAGGMAVVVCMALFLLYRIRGLGAGDVKLLGVMTFFFSENILWMIAGAFLWGAGIALVRMTIRFWKKRQVFIKRETIPFSVPITCSVMTCMLWGGAL